MQIHLWGRWVPRGDCRERGTLRQFLLCKREPRGAHAAFVLLAIVINPPGATSRIPLLVKQKNADRRHLTNAGVSAARCLGGPKKSFKRIFHRRNDQSGSCSWTNAQLRAPSLGLRLARRDVGFHELAE